MSSLSKAHDDFVLVFLKIMFHSLKSLKRKDEREASLQLEQWKDMAHQNLIHKMLK